MKLADLDPVFLHIVGKRSWRADDQIIGADGIMFLCPKCFAANGGDVGTHQVICWKPHVPQDAHMVGPGRWNFAGDSVANLSLVATPSSVKLMGGCNAHFFVERGSIRMV